MLLPAVFVGTSPDKTHSTPTPEKLEAAKRVTPKITLHPQASVPTEATSLGPEGMTHPVRKTLIPPVPDRESKTSETKERGKPVQPEDSQRAKQLPCSSDFCNGRGICTMEGELRKCSCPVENNGEVCEEAARGPALSYITLGSTISFSVVLVALGAFVCFRKDRKLKRWAAIIVLMGECYSKEVACKIRLMGLEIWVHSRNMSSEKGFI